MQARLGGGKEGMGDGWREISKYLVFCAWILSGQHIMSLPIVFKFKIKELH